MKRKARNKLNLQKIAALLFKLVLVFGITITTLPVQAAAPSMLNYQGQLTNAAGVPVNATVSIQFSLYKTLTGGEPVWREMQSVVVSNGQYNTMLGLITPLDPAMFSAHMYLGIKVEADAEMTPRIAMSSSATALHAQTAYSAITATSATTATRATTAATADHATRADVATTADALAPTATVAGSQITGSIPAAQISGAISVGHASLADLAYTADALAPTATVAGSQITGSIPAAQISGAISADHAIFADIATTADALAPTATVAGSQITGTISAPQLNASSAPTTPGAGQFYFNTADKSMYYYDGTIWRTIAATIMPKPVYRWAMWNTFDPTGSSGGWFAGNDGSLFGGVPPASWINAVTARSMAADFGILGTLFNNTKTIASNGNSLVHAENWVQHNSSDSRMVGALFRIRNTTMNPINWQPAFLYTSHGNAVMAERASLALNGADKWDSASSDCDASMSCIATVTLSIPSDQISTVIVVVGSGTPVYTGTISVRSTLLAFINGTLTLPAGLEFVDDLDTTP